MLARQIFVSGLIVTGLFALGHFAGFLRGARAARRDPHMTDLTRAMREHKVNLFGFQPSLLDFREYFSLNFSILLLLAAVLGFVALSITPSQSTVIRYLSVVYLAAMLLLLGTSAYFSVLQGIVSCSLIAILFGVSWWLA